MTLGKRIVTCVGFGVLMFLGNILINFLLHILLDMPAGSGPSEYVAPTVFQILGLIVITPLYEEFVYRFIPIRIMQELTSNKYVLWAVIICFSAIWGALHPYPYAIITIGVFGLLFSRIYLRYGYVGSVASHVTWNSLFVIAYIMQYLFR